MKRKSDATAEIIDTQSKTIVGQLVGANGRATPSRFALEVDFSGGAPVRVGDQFGVGRVTGLGKPTLIPPLGETTADPTFRWQAVPGASWYRVWVDMPDGTSCDQWGEGQTEVYLGAWGLSGVSRPTPMR